MKKTIFLAGILIVFNVILFGQNSQNSTIIQTKKRSTIHVPMQEAPASLKTIYSDLGPKAFPYNPNAGEIVRGPGAGTTPIFFAMPFVPKSDSHVSEVRVAMQYNLSGANQVNLSIYGDSGDDFPGTLLAGPVTVTNLPETGSCCTLVVADFSPLAVTSGKQYWVVADTPLTGTGSDFSGIWEFVPKPVYPQAANFGDGWFFFDGFAFKVAGQVLGTIP